MKKIIIASFVLMAVTVACTRKAAPAATAVAASGMPAMSSASTAQADIDAGHTIFTTKCTKCHGAKDKYVANHTYDEATGVMNAMSKKAGLSQDEINQLAAYVNSAAKK